MSSNLFSTISCGRLSGKQNICVLKCCVTEQTKKKIIVLGIPLDLQLTENLFGRLFYKLILNFKDPICLFWKLGGHFQTEWSRFWLNFNWWQNFKTSCYRGKFWFLKQTFYSCLKNYILKKLLVKKFWDSIQVIYNLVKWISIQVGSLKCRRHYKFCICSEYLHMKVV